MNTVITPSMIANEALSLFDAAIGRLPEEDLCVWCSTESRDNECEVRCELTRAKHKLTIKCPTSDLYRSLKSFADKHIVPQVNRMPQLRAVLARSEKRRRMQVRSQCKFQPWMRRFPGAA